MHTNSAVSTEPLPPGSICEILAFSQIIWKDSTFNVFMCYYDSARKAFAVLGTFHGLPHHTTRDIYLLFWDGHCDYLTPNASPNVPSTVPCASDSKKKVKSTMKDAAPEPEEVLVACSTFECCLKFLPFNNEPEPLFFTKDGNSCHCSALLDAIIFPIIENGYRSIFEYSPLGKTLINLFQASKYKNKIDLSRLFRNLFNGSLDNDTASLLLGTGRYGHVGSLQRSVTVIFGLQNHPSLRFVRDNDASLIRKGYFKCSNCGKEVSLPTVKNGIFAMNNSNVPLLFLVSSLTNVSCNMYH